MVVLNDHTIKIGDMGFYGSNCKSTQPQSHAVNYDLVPIEKGLPRSYPCDIAPRVLTFTAILQGDVIETNEQISKIIGIQDVVSRYLGKFKAQVVASNAEWLDSTPGAVTYQFTITEVASD